MLTRLKAALQDRYTIERELGAGGMATVYIARDLKHDRNVAVKIFRPELAAALGTERFFREIRITANLNHPHILPLLDSGRADSPRGGQSDSEPAEFLYYVMPYVEGESLRDRLNREKQLSVDEALKITSQVASALSYAHSRDIVHRDIKPENILFQAGEAVVADFGIALAVDSAGGDRLTETGFSLGTPAYMSPEQVSGEQEIDGRSDVYSLACVLYEMLAGDPPFVASNPRAVLAKHMTDPAPPVTTVRSDVTEPVAAAIGKALGKAPVARFESAQSFSDALFAAEVSVEEGKKSIVVLPFENLSPDPDNEYFSDGLTDEIIADLSSAEELKVISRTSAMLLKGTDKDVCTIGRELNVRYVLEGSVRKARDSLRITAQLIDATDDVHLWAKKYSGTIDDVFDLQEKVSADIVDALKVKLTPQEREQLADRPIPDVHAYECYMRARHQMWHFTADALEQALGYLREGITVVGDNVLLLAAMAEAEFLLPLATGQGWEQSMKRMDDCTRRIFALEPDSPSGYAILGMTETRIGKMQEAVRHFRQALDSSPDDASFLLFYGFFAAQCGKPEAAQPTFQRLLEIDPLSPINHAVYGKSLHLLGDFDGAEAACETGYRLDPSGQEVGFLYARALATNGKMSDARAVVDAMKRRDPGNAWTRTGEALLLALQDDREGVVRTVTPELEETGRWDETFSLFLAECFALVGESEQALDWLGNAVNRGVVNYPLLLHIDPFLERVRSKPRFVALMERVRKEWEEFEV